MQFRFCDQDGPTNHVYGCIHLFLLFGGELLKNVNTTREVETWLKVRRRRRGSILIKTGLSRLWSLTWDQCSRPIESQNSLKCNNLRWSLELSWFFCMQINIKVFCKVVLPFLVGVERHAKIASQIAEFLKRNYLIKN